MSPAVTGVLTVVTSIVVMWVGVMAFVLYLTDSSTLAAFGVGAYAAFWLGGGFGVIFTSAAVFGGDH